jgi:hypothetical protein
MQAGAQNNTAEVLPQRWSVLKPADRAEMKQLPAIKVPAAHRNAAFGTSTQVASS